MRASGRHMMKSTSISGEIYGMEHADGSQSDTALGSLGSGIKKRRSSLSQRVVAILPSRRSRSTSQLSQTGQTTDWPSVREKRRAKICPEGKTFECCFFSVFLCCESVNFQKWPKYISTLKNMNWKMLNNNFHIKIQFYSRTHKRKFNLLIGFFHDYPFAEFC